MKPHLPDEEKSSPVEERTEAQPQRRASHHHRQFEVMGAHPTGARHLVHRLGAERARGGRDRQLQRLALRAAAAAGRRQRPLERLRRGARAGQCYKFRIQDAWGHWMDKADPYAFRMEHPPGYASQIWDLSHEWGDGEWMRTRRQRQSHRCPISIYEVHLGSWQREEDGRFLNYRDLAQRLAVHCHNLGFTHVELMPVTEHPFYGSWGYQTTGYFAPTSRYGTPQDLMAFVDTLHQQGIGVFLDWVPSHFPADPHALARFDGTPLYEHEDPPRLPPRVEQPDLQLRPLRGPRLPDQQRALLAGEVPLRRPARGRGRLDAVPRLRPAPRRVDPQRARRQPEPRGGRFLQDLNTAVYAQYPDVHMIAEESTPWPAVSRPVYWGGLGFGMKWNMGWMNDTLRVRPAAALLPRNGTATTSASPPVYAFHENFILPLSHDEVVYGKGSLLGRSRATSGSASRACATCTASCGPIRARSCCSWAASSARSREWHHDAAWTGTCGRGPTTPASRAGCPDLNRVYRRGPALHATTSTAGFDWMDCSTASPACSPSSGGRGPGRCDVLAICNITPVPRTAIASACRRRHWHEVLNSDAAFYGGSGVGNLGRVQATAHPVGGWPASALVAVPPVGTVILSNRPIPTTAPTLGDLPMPANRNVLAFVMAGGEGALHPLTADRCKPAVPFNGKHRIVDFVLSNLVNSEIYSIYLLVQYKSQSLIEHVRQTWTLARFMPQHFVTVVPPQMRTAGLVPGHRRRGVPEHPPDRKHAARTSWPCSAPTTSTAWTCGR